MEPLPFLTGGSGRYMYWLVANNYTTGSPTAQSVAVMDVATNDTIVATISLTSSKNFSSLFYRAVDKTVHVVGNNWVDVIDANEASGTLNTKIASRAWALGSASYILGSYLPEPFDFFSSGGTHAKILGGRNFPLFKSADGRFDLSAEPSNPIRLGGHSNTSNIIYYQISQVLQANKIQIKVYNAKSKVMPNVDYSFAADGQAGWYNDLQAINFPVIRFGNFIVVSTGSQAYVMHQDSIGSPLLFPFLTLGVSNRTYHTYCPNAPYKLFFTGQMTDNKITVVGIDVGGKQLIDLGDIDRAAYKDTNESGANVMLYNPHSGRLYVQGNNNLNVTGVTKVHVYDPTRTNLEDMYVRSVVVGEMKSDSRVSVTAQNTCCMNRTQIFEYPNILI